MKSFKNFIEESYFKAAKIVGRRIKRSANTLAKNPNLTLSQKMKYLTHKAAENANELGPLPMNVTGVGSGLAYTAASLIGKPALEVQKIRDRLKRNKLQEALRTRVEAGRLLRDIYPKKQSINSLVSPGRMKTLIPLSPYRYDRDLSFKGQRITDNNFDQHAKTELVATHKISTEQDEVIKNIISKKIRGEHPNNPPVPWILRFTHKGEIHHLAIDGNHTVNKNILRGIPLTRARVLDVDHNSKFLMDQ